ncbi:MAG: right-handed parallel beta-helix repeat-containing protein [Myxococcota bacterium]|nr:right-handed parallel beta-helix repeat-containing protein [Myxococcota bacterium]
MVASTSNRAVLHALSVGVLALALAASPALARDWFVRAGAPGGDGSLGKPFADPWQALEKVEAGDAVHVTVGKYYGRLGTGTWKLPYDGVQLIGGYALDFKSRDPWANPTELLWDKASKNWPQEERVSSLARNTVVDGVVIDMQEQAQYADTQKTGRTEKASEHAMRFALPATVRNSVIINPGEHGIDCPTGSTVENNLILNAITWGVAILSSSEKTPATVRNNTILFTWDPRAAGKGGYRGSAVSLGGPAVVSGNLLAHNDNNGIYLTSPAERVTLKDNHFFMNLYSNLNFGVDGRFTAVDDAQMELMEEVGLKAQSGNEVRNPKLALDPRWMDKFSQRGAAQEGKVEMNDWNQFRQALGLTLIGKGGESAAGIAPPWELSLALKLLPQKAQAGARRLSLEVKPFSGGAEGVARTYASSDLTRWAKDASAVEGQALELIVAVGPVANINGIPAQYDPKSHAGAFLYDQGGKERITGFFKTGSSAQRAVDGASGYFSGSGKPDRLYRARGVAHGVKSLPKAGFFIESLEPYESGGAVARRSLGKDWFVRAGATGGDGSREKPFRDPYQALEQSEAGDSIHVAGGEYFGKLKAGNWRLDTRDLTLLGGYSPDFKTRNPWANPTLLGTAKDYKGRRGGYTLEGAEDHDNTVIDGFVFDKRNNNLYTPEGDLDYSRSDKTEHIWLSRPGCVIRNSVFLNGAEGALRVASGQTVENNIFINHTTKTVNAEPGHGDDQFIFRNNTVAFSWDMRFGEGRGRNGNLLILGTRLRAVVDNNVFAFADNDAIRLNADAKDVELTRNVFSHNLWSNVQKPSGWVAVDDAGWALLPDLGWKKLEGNQVLSPALPLNKDWFDVYLGRTAYTPGKVKMDDWNQLREVLGQPVIATGGKAGKGYAPAYAWKDALQLVPGNRKVTAGARPSDLPVSFTGVERKTEEHEYQEVAWEVAKSSDAWAKLEGQRVMLKVVLRTRDNTYQLPEAPKETFQAFTAAGPEGTESGGLPLRAYVARGTRFERVIQQAKAYSSGTPDQTYVIKGVVRSARQLLVEAVERAD